MGKTKFGEKLAFLRLLLIAAAAIIVGYCTGLKNRECKHVNTVFKDQHNDSLWVHRLNIENDVDPKCAANSVFFDGECILLRDRGNMRYDPCNPRGKRVITGLWKDYNGRSNVQSRTFGVLERHRFDCIVFPRLLKPIMQEKIARLEAVDYNSTGTHRVSHHHAPYLSPIRVLVFGPHGELGKMRTIVEVTRKADKYPLDYVQADLSDAICKEYNAVKINAMSIPFPNNYFNILVFQHILEHVRDLNQSLNEIKRVLAPGGFAVLSCPFDMALPKTIEDPSCTSEECRLRKFRQFDHVRNIGADVIDWLKDRFDFVRAGHYWKYYKSKMPYLQSLFANAEYHSEDKGMYIYVFKQPNEELSQSIHAVFD